MCVMARGVERQPTAMIVILIQIVATFNDRISHRREVPGRNRVSGLDTSNCRLRINEEVSRNISIYCSRRDKKEEDTLMDYNSSFSELLCEVSRKEIRMFSRFSSSFFF